MRRLIGDVPAFEADPPAPRVIEAVDRAQRRRLAGAIRADQRHDLALAYVDRNALESLDRAVIRMDVLELEDLVLLRLRVH
jgi:hypothetical protein